MFILLLHYAPGSLDAIDRLVPEHYAFVDRYLADGTFLLAGRRVPRTGGVFLASGTDRERVERIAAEDPFHRSGAVTYEIIEVRPTRSALPGLPVPAAEDA
ncbi:MULTISPECIES: YciI family protein [Actinomadura]|uniref:YciI family protein n=1 Tax=Actinomadura yumaensis TaxID=111807 RepID=A0ABW2CBW0_9ACTN|nr:YciI family protein [Actinomadura sp. J1-007]MWK38175.1 hypothetical protein [Actinomadura sp. J1-007]